jgi:4-amino-4-deoxy-L-arabinose transferase
VNVSKHIIYLIIILLIGLALRISISRDDFLHKWDERYHALVSKNLMSHPLKPTLYETPLLKYDYKIWYGNHIWLHKQPLPLWLIAISYKLFGLSEFVTRLPSLIFSFLAIIVTYLLGKTIFNKKIGLMAAFFFAVNGLIIEIGAGRIATDHYDTLFLVFIEIAVLFAYYNAQNRKYSYSVLSGVFMGFAILTKWLPCLIVLPIHFFFLLNSKTEAKITIKQITTSLITCLLIALPWQIFILNNYPLEARWEYYHHWLHVSNELDGQNGGYFYYLDKIRINYSEIVYLPVIYCGYIFYKQKSKNYNLFALLFWIIIPIIFFSFVKTKMQGYILFICPALFIITSWFFFEIKDKFINKNISKIAITFVWILLFSIIILPVRYCFERTGFGFKKVEANKYNYEYKSLKHMLPKKSIVLNVKEPIEFMFYNDCVAYSKNKLEESELAKINSEGYLLFYYNEISGTVQRGN